MNPPPKPTYLDLHCAQFSERRRDKNPKHANRLSQISQLLSCPLNLEDQHFVGKNLLSLSQIPSPNLANSLEFSSNASLDYPQTRLKNPV